jgi:hypothetical protein
MKHTNQGVCPYCGNSVVEYRLTYWDDDNTIVQECKCHVCGKFFDEVYDAAYNHTETDED